MVWKISEVTLESPSICIQLAESQSPCHCALFSCSLFSPFFGCIFLFFTCSLARSLFFFSSFYIRSISSFPGCAYTPHSFINFAHTSRSFINSDHTSHSFITSSRGIHLSSKHNEDLPRRYGPCPNGTNIRKGATTTWGSWAPSLPCSLPSSTGYI